MPTQPPTDELAREEVDEFIEALDDVDDSPDRQKVLEHLQQTRTVVAVQLLGDIDRDGEAAAGTFLPSLSNIAAA